MIDGVFWGMELCGLFLSGADVTVTRKSDWRPIFVRL